MPKRNRYPESVLTQVKSTQQPHMRDERSLLPAEQPGLHEWGGEGI